MHNPQGCSDTSEKREDDTIVTDTCRATRISSNICQIIHVDDLKHGFSNGRQKSILEEINGYERSKWE